jgi:integrase
MAENHKDQTKMPKLTVRTIEKVAKTPGRHPFGDGLYLWVRGPTARYWTHRYRVAGRQTETSLGPYPDTLIEDVIAKHAAQRAQVVKKIDPVGDKRARRKAVRAVAGTPTFGQIVDRYIESREDSWKNRKHRQQWVNTTKAGSYCEPIRALPVDRVTTAMIHDLLEPLWKRAPETAQRVRGRIEQALDFAQARGHIDEDRRNPARWKGRLDKLLAKPPKHVNHTALPYAEIPHFMARLRKRGERDVAARALEFAVLTAARSGEVFGMVWDEVNLDEGLWTVPAARMKADRLHRVPLSDRTIEILKGQLETAPRDDEGRLRNPHVFPGRRPMLPLSNMAMTVMLRRMNVTRQVDGEATIVTAHGMRSSFRDWVGDKTNFPREVAEAALAHIVGDEAEQAYRRGDALEKRGMLMDDWAAYCDPAPTGGKVIPIGKARA